MRRLIVLGGLALLWSLLTAPAFAGLANFKTTVGVPDGWQTTVTVDWTQGGTVIESETFRYKNTTGSQVDKTFTSAAPSDADNMEEHSKTKKIPATATTGADLKLPSVSPDTLASYLASNG